MFRFGPFEVDFTASRLSKSGASIHVQDQQLLILQALLERPGEIVTREQLRSRLWASETFVDFERSLNAAVAKLRQSLSDSAERPLYIETVARKGYRFIAPVTSLVTADASPPAQVPPSPKAGVSRRRVPFLWLLMLLPAVVVLVGAVLLFWSAHRTRTAVELGSIRFSVSLPEGMRLAEPSFGAQFAISPDGRKIALVASSPDGIRIWWRPLASEMLSSLEGTEAATFPFWSADGEEIGFFASGKLKVVKLPDGPVRTICELPAFFGASWSTRDVILFSNGTALLRVGVFGGGVTQVTGRRESLGQTRLSSPQFLPDQMHFVYFANSVDSNKSGMYLAALDGSEPRLILLNPTPGAFAPSNDLLFVREGTLFTQKLNREYTRVEEKPVALASHVNAAYGQAAFSVSRNGVVIYRTTEGESAQLAMYSREGERVQTFGSPGPYTQVTISPDEKVAALSVKTPSDRMEAERIWLLRLQGGVVSRLDFGAIANSDPVWSPDSRQIAFASSQAQGQRTKIFRWSMGEPAPTLLLDDGHSNKPDDWSPDGFLLCRRDNSVAFALPARFPGAPHDLGDRPFLKDQLHLSPDGTKVAYNTWATSYYTDRINHPDVFVATFPAFRDTSQASADGGVQPFWSRGGRDLYYLAPEGSLMWIDIGSRGTVRPKVLFRSSLQPNQWRSQYSVSADGQRIYLLEPVTRQRDLLHVITRWAPARSQ